MIPKIITTERVNPSGVLSPFIRNILTGCNKAENITKKRTGRDTNIFSKILKKPFLKT
tara:strand:- start:247 stop:420 length:174 start_codon:yes stop_codon:yes gene_type:complete